MKVYEGCELRVCGFAPREEPNYWSIECIRCGLQHCPTESALLQGRVDTAFDGRGAKQKAEKALRLILEEQQ